LDVTLNRRKNVVTFYVFEGEMTIQQGGLGPKIDPVLNYNAALNAIQAYGAGARLFALQEALAAARSADQGRKAAWLRLAAETETAKKAERPLRKAKQSRATGKPRPETPKIVRMEALPAPTRAAAPETNPARNAALHCVPQAEADTATLDERGPSTTPATPVARTAPEKSAIDPEVCAYMDSLDPRRPSNPNQVAEMLVTVFGVGATCLAQSWIRQMQAEGEAEAVLSWAKVAAVVGQILAAKLQSMVVTVDRRAAA
jgi:hypothetical protein